MAVSGLEPRLNILEIVKPVETLEVVIDPDAHHDGVEAQIVEDGQVITLDDTKHVTVSDETSEQVTRWAAALEGYRKEQERLGIPYGKYCSGCGVQYFDFQMLVNVCNMFVHKDRSFSKII